MQNNEQIVVAKEVEEYALVIQNITNKIFEILKQLAIEIAAALREIAKRFWDIIMFILLQYPNRRVVWLAFRHKKERVRKKNLRRIMQELKRR